MDVFTFMMIAGVIVVPLTIGFVLLNRGRRDPNEPAPWRYRDRGIAP